jgi:hypothetical protein
MAQAGDANTPSISLASAPLERAESEALSRPRPACAHKKKKPWVKSESQVGDRSAHP